MTPVMECHCRCVSTWWVLRDNSGVCTCGRKVLREPYESSSAVSHEVQGGACKLAHLQADLGAELCAIPGSAVSLQHPTRPAGGTSSGLCCASGPLPSPWANSPSHCSSDPLQLSPHPARSWPVHTGHWQGLNQQFPSPHRLCSLHQLCAAVPCPRGHLCDTRRLSQEPRGPHSLLDCRVLSSSPDFHLNEPMGLKSPARALAFISILWGGF